MFSNAALSRSQFCFDPLQIYRQETLLSSNVCYWKSAKSVNNFRSKKRTAFEKNRLFGFQAGVGGPWFESRRGRKFCNLIFLVFLNYSYYTKKKLKHRKWLNILLTPWCSCYMCSLQSTVYCQVKMGKKSKKKRNLLILNDCIK